jgi:hypothetical protein
MKMMNQAHREAVRQEALKMALNERLWLVGIEPKAGNLWIFQPDGIITVEPAPLNYPCPHCNSRFWYEGQLDAHIESEHAALGTDLLEAPGKKNS